MKRRQIWKKQEAVSPVIATILMVAITVVLAATLYMMLPGGDDTGTLLSGRISVRTAGTQFSMPNGTIQIEFSMTAPRSVQPDRLTIDLINPAGASQSYVPADTAWSLLGEDNRVVTGTRLTIPGTAFNAGDTLRGSEIVVRVDGYDGTMSVVAQ